MRSGYGLGLRSGILLGCWLDGRLKYGRSRNLLLDNIEGRSWFCGLRGLFMLFSRLWNGYFWFTDSTFFVSSDVGGDTIDRVDGRGILSDLDFLDRFGVITFSRRMNNFDLGANPA